MSRLFKSFSVTYPFCRQQADQSQGINRHRHTKQKHPTSTLLYKAHQVHAPNTHAKHHTMKRKPKRQTGAFFPPPLYLGSPPAFVYRQLFSQFSYVPYVQVCLYHTILSRIIPYKHARTVLQESANLPLNRIPPSGRAFFFSSPPTTMLEQALHNIGKPLQE